MKPVVVLAEAVREGRWNKARLTYNSELMPVGTVLPADANSFPLAYLVFDAGLAVVAEATQPFPDRPTFQIPISVNR